jgi:hypothetical protein
VTRARGAGSVLRLLAAGSLLGALAAQAQVAPWRGQTPSLSSFSIGDVALVELDGAAPLVAAADPTMNGLYLFELDAGVRQLFAVGAVRGVDARPGLVAATAPFQQQVFVLGVGADGGFGAVAPSLPIASINTVAFARTGPRFELWVDLGAQFVKRYRADDAGFTFLETVTLTRPPTSLVFDDRAGRLYIASLDGVSVLVPGGAPELLIELDAGQFGGLPAGQALYPLRDGGVLLVTAVPSRSDFVVHRVFASTADFLGRFSVGPPDGGLLRVTNSVGLDLTARAAPGFDAGLLVVGDALSASVKLVGWEDVAAQFSPPLPVEVPALAARDAGAPDSGVADAGAPDAGPRDGGASDAGGGTGGGTGAGGGGGSTGGGSASGGGSGSGGGRATGGGTGVGGGGGTDQPMGCTCAQVDFTVIPALAGLWWLAARRRRTLHS